MVGGRTGGGREVEGGGGGASGSEGSWRCRGVASTCADTASSVESAQRQEAVPDTYLASAAGRSVSRTSPPLTSERRPLRTNEQLEL